MESTDQLADSVAFSEIKLNIQSLRPALNPIAIQAIPSQLYLTEGNFWSRDIEMAKTFESGAVALKEAKQLKLQNFQLVPRQLG